VARRESGQVNKPVEGTSKNIYKKQLVAREDKIDL
jgi:hypothetical protein